MDELVVKSEIKTKIQITVRCDKCNDSLNTTFKQTDDLSFTIYVKPCECVNCLKEK